MVETALDQFPPEFYSLVVQGSIDPILVIDDRGRVLHLNPAAEKAFLYAANEIVGQNIKILMPEPYHSKHDGYLDHYRRTGEKKIIGSGREVEAQRKDGSVFPIHLSISEIAFEGKRVFLGVVRDISQLKTLQTDLAESQERSEGLIRSAVDGIITIDSRGVIQDLNPAACEMFEYRSEELIGKNVKVLMPEPDRAQHDGYLDNYHRTGEKKIIGIGREVVCKTRSGKTFPAHLSISEYLLRGKRCFSGIIRDISEVKQYEARLKSLNEYQSQQLWSIERQLRIVEFLGSNPEGEEFYSGLLDCFTEVFGAIAGCVYKTSETTKLDEKQDPSKKPYLVFACGNTAPIKEHESIEFGCGIVGQAAADRRVRILENQNEFFVESSFGTLKPNLLMAVPIARGDNVFGVIELAFSGGQDQDLITQVLENTRTAIAIAVEAMLAKQQVNELYLQAQTQSQRLEVSNLELKQKTQELTAQQEELAVTNEELSEKTEKLQSQQEELQAQNEELEEQKNAVSIQKEQLEQSNQELNRSQRELRIQQDELQAASKYKSEFLANMSHELRTPLNSLLILAKLLTENETGNLTEEQVNYSSIIYNAGSDLLSQINDILDLSKVEAGKLEVKLESCSISAVVDAMERLFKHSIDEKGLRFELSIGDDLPATIKTDRMRLEQILKNLLSNALKFTETGNIELKVDRQSRNQVGFAVVDSGIGIPKEKRKEVFGAFTQIDGTLNRKFMGTGLGLSISQSLANLLGGELLVESQVAVGSKFTLVLPLEQVAEDSQETPGSLKDDRLDIQAEDSVVLIGDNDVAVARQLMDVARSRGYKCVFAPIGEEVLQLAAEFSPQLIFLEAEVRDAEDVTVLKRLRDNGKTSLTPTILLLAEGAEPPVKNSFGATWFLEKPIQHDSLIKIFSEANKPANSSKILLVEDDRHAGFAIQQVLNRQGYTVEIAATTDSARQRVGEHRFDCLVLDLHLGEESGLEFLGWLKQSENNLMLPVVVHTGTEISHNDEERLLENAKSIIIKSAHSPERLVDEVARAISSKSKVVEERIFRLTKDAASVLKGRQVLVVDDDMRNAYSLKQVLRRRDMRVLIAKNGREAVEMIHAEPEIDIVLMDIMMPEMDGLEAMRRIRADRKYAKLPIIALTAKAMADDRNSCIDAGASDYLSKPVDLEQLAKLMTMLLRD